MRAAAPVLGRATVALVMLAALAVVATNRRDEASAARASTFHALAGGLGSGPSLDLSECEPSFDPRVGSECPRQFGPVPGGGPYCPRSGAVRAVPRR